MSNKKFRYIYGPVSSWRLGSSLGIDPISNPKKLCTFDCVYCQLGRTKVFRKKRLIYIPTREIIKEIKRLPPVKIDYITFSGMGEPTLAKNLGEIISKLKDIRQEPIAVISNASLIYRVDVQRDLRLADLVMLKIDAPTQDMFTKINRPIKSLRFSKIIDGIKRFRSIYKGRLAIQIMFIEKNKGLAKEIAQLVKRLSPDEVQLSTPLRPCAVMPLPKEEFVSIKRHFKDIEGKVICVYDVKKKKTDSIDKIATLMRRGRYD